MQVSRSYKYIVMVTLIGFLLSALIPFFAVYDTNSVSDDTASLFGDKILICTAEGYKWVDLANAQAPKHDNENSHYKCPLCVVAAQGGVTPNSSNALSFAYTPYNSAHLYTSNAHIIVHVEALFAVISPRAPPFYIS